jgi:hypothetical protein
MKSQFFSHRPPSNTTLLNDPWPDALLVRKHRKTFEWPPYRGNRGFANSQKADRVTGLQS